MRRVMKWNVMVDDMEHKIGIGKAVHVASQFGKSYKLQVWTEEECDENGILRNLPRRTVRVVGTGHRVPEFGDHIGTVVAAGGHLVWHVYEVPA